MKKTIYLNVMVLICISATFWTCKKEKDPGKLNQEVTFVINISNSKSASALKSALAYSLSDAKKIVLTIQNADGTSTSYTSAEVKLYQMNGAFFSQKLILITGSYRLTEFLLLDSTGNTIYATPITGSQEAQNVTNPLSISFEVIKDASTPINVEVLSTENMTPGDFGLVRFPISEIKVLNFMIAVADIENDELLSVDLTVSSVDYTHNQVLPAIANNMVTISDAYDTYVLTIQKEGYKTFTHVFSKDSLKLFNGNGNHKPLVVELEKNNTFLKTTNGQTNNQVLVLRGDNIVYAGKDFNSQQAFLKKADNLGHEIWSKIYSLNYSITELNCLVKTSDGGFILCGNITHGGMDYDGFAIRVDANGNELWSHSYGASPNAERINSVVQTNDGGFILCGFTGNGFNDDICWMLKTDGNGNIEWNKTYGNGQLHSIKQANDYNFVSAGFSTGTPGTTFNSLIIKIDQNGNTILSKDVIPNQDIRILDLQKTQDGNFIMAGSSIQANTGDLYGILIKTDNNGNILWSTTYSDKLLWIVSIIPTIDGGYILGGQENYSPMNGFLLKTNSSGVEEWRRTYPSNTISIIWSVSQSSDNGYIVAGGSGASGVLMKTSPNGLIY
jgi:hypothetical protein